MHASNDPKDATLITETFQRYGKASKYSSTKTFYITAHTLFSKNANEVICNLLIFTTAKSLTCCSRDSMSPSVTISKSAVSAPLHSSQYSPGRQVTHTAMYMYTITNQLHWLVGKCLLPLQE